VTNNEKIEVCLSNHEALILFDWLVRFNASGGKKFEDQAEQRVLWDLESSLESKLAEVVSDEYAEQLALARSVVRDRD
jgi:hypothetical protein